MKDIKISPLHHFLCLFAEPVQANSSSNVDSQTSTTNTELIPSSSSGRIHFQEKSKEWAMDGIGFKPLFLKILSFLDEYDLAQSIEPVCKLFRNFALLDHLWEELLRSFLRDRPEEWKKGQEMIEVRLKRIHEGNTSTVTGSGSSGSACKNLMVEMVRTYYQQIGNNSLTFSTPGEYGMWGVECAECQAKIEHRETFISDSDSGDYFHIDCFSRERFWECCENYNQCKTYSGWIKEEIINRFFKRRMIGGGGSKSGEEDDEEEEDEEELPEFSCDVCEEPIAGIRYNCLDCDGEYDLCGYCCEKLVMKQKGSELPMCNNAAFDHPHEHVFQTIGDERFDIYSCNNCLEKIRGYRHVDPSKEDYDLCATCFYKIVKEEEVEGKSKRTPFERYDLFGNNCIDSLFDEFCKKLLLKELKDVYAELGEESGNLPKRELAEELLNVLEEKREDGKCPFLTKLVSLVPRLCCKDGEGSTLPETACNALVYSLEVVANNEKVAKPPKKKTKRDD